MSLDFIIIGGNIAGLLSAKILVEDNKISLIEKDPIDNPSKEVPLLIAGYFSNMLERKGIEIDKMDPIFFDEVHVHGSDGRTVLETNFEFLVSNYGKMRRETLRTIDGLNIRDKCVVAGKYIEDTELIKKIMIENKKRDVLEAKYIIDASGFDMFLTKRVMSIERHTIRRHNMYTFFHALYKDAHHRIEKSAIHFLINNTTTPGGISVIFSLNDEIHIFGFYNRRLSSIMVEKRCNWIKNMLGIFARLSKIEKHDIVLGKPLLTASYKNAFLLGASNMSIYPLFFSGIPHNVEQTDALTRLIYNLTSDEKEPCELMLEYNIKSLSNRIFRGILNDFFRLLLISIRDEEIEEIADKVIDLIKMFTMFPRKVDIFALDIASTILRNSRMAIKLQQILRLAVDLYRTFDMQYDSMDKMIKTAREFNLAYDKNIKDILKQELNKKP